MKINLFQKQKDMTPRERRAYLGNLLINNSLSLFLLIAVIFIACLNPRFLSWPSIINIISLSAANLPIALGIAGAIILTGTDLSAGRIVGLVACVSAALLQSTGYAGKMFPALKTPPIAVVFLFVILIGALAGFINGYSAATFHLHPFIVTLSTQLIITEGCCSFSRLATTTGSRSRGSRPPTPTSSRGA